MIIINGKEMALQWETLEDYILSQNYLLEHIAVERNEVIVPKAAYGQTKLLRGDLLEVVCFVGGG